MTLENSDMTASPPPIGFEEIQRHEMTRLFGRMVWVRLLAFPLLFALLAWFVFTDPSAWRRGLAVVAGVALSVFFVNEALRFRKRGMGRFGLEINLAVAVVGHLAMVSGTGGIESPFIYAMMPIGFVVGIFVTAPTVYILAGLQIAWIWALAAIEVFRLVQDFNPLALGGGPRAGHNDEHLWTATLVLSIVAMAGVLIGRNARRIFNAMIRQALSAQQESLRTHAERAQELTALSAEIAHELKNPLASVKGLAGLLSESVADQRGTERLTVLRHEVGRMQSILEGFLNFSRPLVPLTLGKVDLSALCQEVAALHEGMAQERRMGVRVQGSGVTARCDRRKVKQVLINLVQNAIEASSSGSVIEIVAGTSTDGGAHVRVLDRGHGLEARLGDKVFEPGVTTKAQGSGLGLTIARALARQHGGELTIAERPGGGCIGQLSIPAESALPVEAPIAGEAE